MCRQSEKNVKQQYALQMSPQYGELRPTSGCDRFVSLEHPTKFQLVSRLGRVTARHVVVGVSQTLRRWTEVATCVWQGDHHVGHWPTFLVHNVLRLSICALFAKIQCDKFVRWCAYGEVLASLRRVFSAIRLQHISDLHSKFTLRPHHVWKYGRHPICDGWE